MDPLAKDNCGPPVDRIVGVLVSWEKKQIFSDAASTIHDACERSSPECDKEQPLIALFTQFEFDIDIVRHCHYSHGCHCWICCRSFTIISDIRTPTG